MLKINKGILSLVSVVLCSSFIACGGGGGGGSEMTVEVTWEDPAPVSEFTFFVDGTFGSDWNSGSGMEPLQTITTALLAAHSGDSIKVAPGVYDAVHGEVFPMHVPPGVTLVGGEDSKSIKETVIYGGGTTFVPHLTAAVQMYSSSVLSGFMVQNSHWIDGQTLPAGILVTGDNAYIVDNVVFYNQYAGIYCAKNSEDLWVVNNTIEGSLKGLTFQNGSSGVVEDNIIQGNNLGVEIHKADVNLGGAPGCKGGNLFTKNTGFDLYIAAGFLLVFAKNNYWDKFPPVAGVDYYKTISSNVLTDGAGHASEYLF